MMKRFIFLIAFVFLATSTTTVLAQLRTNSNTVRTQVGDPPVQSSGGWPTTGYLTQGPNGAYDHGRIRAQTGADGLDIADPSGPPVYSTFDGVVASVNDCSYDGCVRGWGGYGNSVLVTSDNGAFSVLYGHFSSFAVVQGQSVRAGDLLGYMGTTGVSTGVHLHWEFRGIPMQPPYIPQPITPFDCDSPSVCTPSYVTPDAASI